MIKPKKNKLIIDSIYTKLVEKKIRKHSTHIIYFA